MGRTRIKLVQGDEIKEEKKEEKKKRTKKKTFVDLGIFYINSHFNNTLISFTDKNGNVLAWSSCGYAGFKNTKKATPYAGAKAHGSIIRKNK